MHLLRMFLINLLVVLGSQILLTSLAYFIDITRLAIVHDNEVQNKFFQANSSFSPYEFFNDYRRMDREDDLLLIH